MSGSPGIALDFNITDMNNHQFEKKFQFILLGFRTFDKNGKIFPATIYLNTATVEFKIFYNMAKKKIEKEKNKLKNKIEKEKEKEKENVKKKEEVMS